MNGEPEIFPLNEPLAIERVMALMAIPGKSTLEGQVAEHLRSALAEAGVSAAIQDDEANQRSPAGGEAGNLIVQWPGTLPGPRRLLMAHIDTVPLCVGCQPVREGDWVRSADPATALGGDDRAGAAVLLNTLLTIQEQNLPHPPLTFLWCVQEEIGLYGARFVDAALLGGPELCFNWDGADPSTVAIGATGDYMLDVEIQGLASHAGVAPEQGISAIAIAALAIADLQRNGWHGLIVKGEKTGTSNVGIIQAGDATNVVTPHLYLRAEARSHDPEFRKVIVAEFKAAFERAVQQVRTASGEVGSVDFSAELKYESFRLDSAHSVVQTAMNAIAAVGLTPRTRIANGGLDANWMVSHGFPTVTLGCGQDGIHTVKERLHLPGYLNACRIALLLATGQPSA